MNDVSEKKYNTIKIDDRFELKNVVSFCAANATFLFNAMNGSAILFDVETWQRIINGDADEDIVFVLHQRGFFENFEYNYDIQDVRPTFFLINMTDSCNLRCQYCFRDVHNNVVPNISRNETIRIASKIIDYCKKNNVNNISIQPWGGEPLIAYNEIITLDEVFKQYDIEYKIVFATNATLINELMAIEFRKRDFHVGISLDGNEILHNLQRPMKGNLSNSFLGVKKGIQNLRNAGFDDIGVIGTITKLTINHVEEIIDTYVYEFEFHSIKLNLVKTNPFSSETYEIAISNKEEISQFYDALINKLIQINQSGYYIFERNIADKLQNLLSSNYSNICMSHGCLGGYKMISFNKFGDIYPCELVDVEDVKIGNVFNEDIVESISHIKNTNPFFKSHEIERCQKCNWRCFCRGGCSASVIYSNYNNEGCDELECMINEVLYPKLIDLILNQPDTIEFLSNRSVRMK